MTAKTISPSFP